jgi:predicted GIY-YIG superfamily endonuclease
VIVAGRIETTDDTKFMAWMYILECSDGSYYVGSTKDLDFRLSEHQAGKGQSILLGDYQSNLFIPKNMSELSMHMLEKSRFKIGVEQNVKR